MNIHLKSLAADHPLDVKARFLAAFKRARRRGSGAA
jgi:hypothetical protein